MPREWAYEIPVSIKPNQWHDLQRWCKQQLPMLRVIPSQQDWTYDAMKICGDSSTYDYMFYCDDAELAALISMTWAGSHYT